MCSHDNGELKVRHLLESAGETDFREEGTIVSYLSMGLRASSFFEEVLTSERARFLIGEMSIIIGRLSSRLWGLGDFDQSREFLFRGHAFLNEVRQKAVALRADPDLIEVWYL